MRRTSAAAMLVPALMAAACATAPSPPPEVPFSVPEAWTASAMEAPVASDLSPWWQRFDDPILDTLIEEALELSPTLEAARARLAAALGSARIAGADSKPQADLSLDGGRRRQNFIGFPIPGTEGDVLSNTSTSLGSTLGASWEVDLWGRLSAGTAAARARGEAAAADLDALRLSLIGQVSKGWFTWLEAHEQVALAQATLDTRRRTREQIEDRYRLGLRTALDLRLAKVSEADAMVQLSVRRQNADQAARRLEVLVVRYPSGDSWTQDAKLPPALPPITGSQPAELVTQRPDLAAAELRLAAAGLDVAGAKAALYPRLRLSGLLGRSSIDLEDLLDDDFSVWSLAAGLLQPLFQGGRLRAAVDVAQARRQEAAAGYISAALTAFGEVESALALEGFVQERLAALSEATQEALAARELAERRYRSGLADYLTVLESQRLATLNEAQLLAVRRQQFETRVDLHLALGGDYSRDVAAPIEDVRKSQ